MLNKKAIFFNDFFLKEMDIYFNISVHFWSTFIVQFVVQIIAQKQDLRSGSARGTFLCDESTTEV